MADCYIDIAGRKTYYTNHYRRHREDGPAVIWPNGTLEFWLNDKPYSLNGNPTDTWVDGSKLYYGSNQMSDREGQPAYMSPNGLSIWYNGTGKAQWPKL